MSQNTEQPVPRPRRMRPKSEPPRGSFYGEDNLDVPPVPSMQSPIRSPRTSPHNSESYPTISGKEVYEYPDQHLEQIAVWGSQSSQDFIPIRNRVWRDLSNKQLPIELPELIIRRLEKTDGETIPKLQRSYVAGVPVKDILPSAVTLKVGLTFLPGANMPQVARLEQQFSQQGKLKGALWKVNTAGLLLTDIDVGRDLSVIRQDQSLSIANRARSRRPVVITSDTTLSSMKQMTLSKQKSYEAAVTVDSDMVEVVEDLKNRRDEWDLEATLIEVDGSSMIDLMIHYRQLVQRGGEDMTFDVRRELLETMIEDARRLVLRSPVLFRMSTRAHIIASRNTRYGIDYDRCFQTLTTSKGIKEAIRLSAAYFDSLKPLSAPDDTQAFLRPKFLQMIVLLLSLLNDDDLADIANFLETTYQLKADRKHLEILFLKVIPLTSINPSLFLRAMTVAYDQGVLDTDAKFENQAQMSRSWDSFVKTILSNGFLLPGSLGNFTRKLPSWIHRWPEHGYDTATVFRHLQYSGSEHRAFNDVQPLELHTATDVSEVSVILSNNQFYKIMSNDLGSLTCMVPGEYLLYDADGKTHNLLIREFDINESLRQAVDLYNSITSRYNDWVLQQSTSEKRWKLSARSRRGAKRLLDEYRHGCGSLTRTRAMLDEGIDICSCFKVEGRRIPRRDAAQTMIWPANDMSNMCNFFESELSAVSDRRYANEKELIRRDLANLRGRLRRIQTEVSEWTEADSSMAKPDEPIAKVLHAGGVDPREPVWFDYESCLAGTFLRITSLHSKIEDKHTEDDSILAMTISIGTETWKVFVTPVDSTCSLEDLTESIEVNDKVALVGQYAVIGLETHEEEVFHMACYLRIKTVVRPKISKRMSIWGIHRMPQPSSIVFC